LSQGLDIIRLGVDAGYEFLDIRKVPKSLDASGRGTGANRHKKPGLTPYFQDSGPIIRRRDGTFDQ
jgi:hypothetical protein